MEPTGDRPTVTQVTTERPKNPGRVEWGRKLANYQKKERKLKRKLKKKLQFP